MIEGRDASDIVQDESLAGCWDGTFACWKCVKRDVREIGMLCKYCGRKPSDQKGGQLPICQWSLELLVMTQKLGTGPGDAQWSKHERAYAAAEEELVYGG